MVKLLLIADVRQNANAQSICGDESPTTRPLRLDFPRNSFCVREKTVLAIDDESCHYLFPLGLSCNVAQNCVMQAQRFSQYLRLGFSDHFMADTLVCSVLVRIEDRSQS